MALVTNGPGTLVLGTADRAAAVATVKARLRVASADDDALIAAFAETALGLCERVIGQATIARTMTQEVSGGGWQRLAARPVGTIGGVSGIDGTALAAPDYSIDVDGAGLGWVRLHAAGGRARATFTAGLAADWPNLPAAIRDGAAMLAAHLYDDRTGREPVPAAVMALWRPYRVIRLDAERRA